MCVSGETLGLLGSFFHLSVGVNTHGQPGRQAPSKPAVHSMRATQGHVAEVTAAPVAGREPERSCERARKLLTGWLSYKIINQTCISLKARKKKSPAHLLITLLHKLKSFSFPTVLTAGFNLVRQVLGKGSILRAAEITASLSRKRIL